MGQEFQKIKDLISSGENESAFGLINKINPKSLSRNETLELAGLARRIGNPIHSLKLLKETVRSDNPLIKPKEEEVIEYTNALSAIGGASEAMTLLQGLKAESNNPKVILYLAFSHFFLWNYDLALQELQEYVELIPEDAYESYIAKVNITACHIYLTHFNEAEQTLDSLLPALKKNEHWTLYANCLELLSQVHFQQEKYESAKAALHEAEEHLKGKYPDWIYVQKWLTLIDLANDPEQQKDASPINKVRDLAISHGDWETLRDLDLWYGIIADKPDLVEKVYFGSSRGNFKARAEQFSKKDIPETFVRYLGGSSEDAPSLIVSSRDDSWKKIFPKYSLEQELFKLFLSDFYRPLSLTEIFFYIYPDEIFNAPSSVNKVRVLITRLNKVLKPNGLEIKGKGGVYYELTGHKPMRLVYSKSYKLAPQSRTDYYESTIAAQFGDKTFNTSEVMTALGLPERQARRVVKALIDAEKLERSGAGKATSYRLSSRG